VVSGRGVEAGGAIASIGTAWIFLVPLWGWAGRRYGLRRLLVAGYGIAGLMTVATAAAFQLPWVGAAALVLAGLGAEMIDGAGNLLFLRAVHPYERSVSGRDLCESFESLTKGGLVAFCLIFEITGLFFVTTPVSRQSTIMQLLDIG
jgi:MFS family permease